MTDYPRCWLLRLTRLSAFLAAVSAAAVPAWRVSAEDAAAPAPIVMDDYEVVIVGGSTAALAAAIASAEQGAQTALLEPTDWIGGQLTSSGVPAVDEAWHSITDKQSGKVLLDVAAAARDPRNMTPRFRKMLVETGCPGECWVSRFCFPPKPFHDDHLLPAVAQVAKRLTVYPNTVLKSLTTNEEQTEVRKLTAIRRFPKTGVKWQGYDRLPSTDLVDWYSDRPSDRFDKKVLRFEAPRGGKRLVVLDATEWGEVLALCGGRYLVGVDDYDGALDGDDTNGQATVYGVVQEYSAEPKFEEVPDLGVENLGYGPYSDREDAWQRIWTYRRLIGSGSGPQPGDLSLQNWGYSDETKDGGNDYPFGYLFKTKAATQEEAADWHGGIDLEVLAASEKRALAWHYWLKANAPEGIEPEQITLAIGPLGTGHGLSKLPYIRDTRRSIGLDGYVLRFADLTGSASQTTGTKFADRIAIGAYPADIHPLVGREYPDYIHVEHDTLPFHVPFRALTHYKVTNLLVAGKTMAQSFLANSATRLHPTEWSTGTAAGCAAAMMVEWGWDTADVYERVTLLQAVVKEKTPIDWTLD